MNYKNVQKYLDLIDYIKGIHIEDEYKKQLLYSIDKICEKVEGIGYDNGYDDGYYNGYVVGYEGASTDEDGNICEVEDEDE